MDNTVGSPLSVSKGDPVTTEVKNQNSFELSNYYTPVSLRNIPEYISGYVDGEGCFTVTFNKRTKAKLGWELRPSFSVSQNEDRRQVLDIIQKYFGCGYIRRDYADKTVKFEIRDHNDLVGKIVPHFRKFPLLSNKQNDFELFCSICEIISKQKHLRRGGFVKIIRLAYQMNGSGKRKRTQEEIISSILEKKI